MRLKMLGAILLTAGILISAGCSKPVATVNGKKIDQATLDLHLREKVQDHKMQNVKIEKDKLKESVLQELIGERLMLDEAAAQGMKVSDEEVNKQIDGIRKNIGDEQFNKALKEKGITLDAFKQRTREKLLLTKFITNLVNADAVTDDEIRDYYKNSQKPFMKPLRVNMRMMEFETETEAKAVAEDMKKNKIDFDDMTKKLSDKSKATATDYGWVSPDFFSPSLANSIKNIKAGQYGGPYKGQKSYFLVKVKERENESIAPFDEVKDNIRNILLAQKRQEAVAHWIEQKKKSSKIVINLK
jgi:foldase protein PrsA